MFHRMLSPKCNVHAESAYVQHVLPPQMTVAHDFH